ncbi:peptide ligase PGM1-related protein [Lentzea aerocolonigenes]|uniref:preATP grasp domain-containing protein n=1 Tax=Lentzea aerocolonigenes TaxID=68170 RepID=UPI0006972E64|nr:peptide ligase PGM1-related protein [Lentzea aerocolonigenes]
MPKLLIGNWSNEPELEHMTDESRRHVGAQGQRMIWSAGPGDVVVLPFHPAPGFLAYVTDLLGFGPDDVHVLVPPEGKLTDVLTSDRLEAPAFVAELGEVITERGIRQVEAFYLDDYVNRLINRLGLTADGFAFVDQGGNELLNSKVVFRAIAAGIGLPLADGIVTDVADDAIEFLCGLLGTGRSAIVKQDVHVAGLGNEILSPAAGIEAQGALHWKVLPSRESLVAHVGERWSWYTSGLRRRVVLEEYLPGSVSLWGEADISADGVEVFGHGQIRLAPILDGVVIPAPPEASGAPAFPGFLADLARLAEAMRAMGYRGLTNIDAMLTADGRIVFNEFNARHGGSTHLFRIGQRVIGGDHLTERCLIERRDCAFPEFPEALRVLGDRGLAYDPATRTGVIIPVYGSHGDGLGGEVCVVGEDLVSAEATERLLVDAFSG